MHDVELRIPPPYPVLIKANFTMDHGRITVILTEGRRMLLRSGTQPVIDGVAYRADKCDLKKATEAFIAKYGPEHMDMYFTGRRRTAYLLTPLGTESSAKPETAHQFILPPAEYSYRIQHDPVQIHLRMVASEYLKKFISSGKSILEIGCSNGFELNHARDGIPGIHCTCADVSADAIKFARDNSPAGTYDNFLKVSGNWNEIIGSFDIIYSTFGATDTSPFEIIASFAKNNLNRNGIFIGTALNRFALSDLMLSVISGKKGYAKDRASGIIHAEYSRYPVAVLSRSWNDIGSNTTLRLIKLRGISFLLAPYNYRRLNRILFRLPFIRWLDWKLSGIFPFSLLCEYLLYVMRAEGG